MFNAFISLLLNIVGTLIQIILLPINAIITATLPSISEQILTVTNGISSLFSGIGWAMGLLPPTLLATLTFILAIEIAKHTIWANSHAITKVWLVLQKIKFW